MFAVVVVAAISLLTSYAEREQVLLFTSVPSLVSHSSVLRRVARLRRLCTCELIPRVWGGGGNRRWAPVGLLFDSMLSEWLISQRFDLLQLLEPQFGASLDLTHLTDYDVAALYIPCSFHFSFCKGPFYFYVLPLEYYSFDMVLLHTHTHARANRLNGQSVFVPIASKQQE